MPAERAVLETRVEHTQDDAVRAQLNDAVDRIVAALRDTGYDAIVDLDAIETVPAVDRSGAVRRPERSAETG